MSEEEKKATENDILLRIDMQLYDEFNDKIAEMNEHLGDVYSLRDVEEVEKAEKEKEIKLLRQAIKQQQIKLEQEKEKVKSYRLFIEDRQDDIYNIPIILEKNAKEKLNTNIYVESMQLLLNSLNFHYISKDKIREKIKELEKYVNDFEEYWSKDPRKFKKEKCIDYYKLEALKELLED